MTGASRSEPDAVSPLLFAGVNLGAARLSREDALLASAYERVGRTLDDLPYTEEFEALHRAIVGDLASVDSRRDLFHRLHNLRKAGRLPRVGRALAEPVQASARERERLADLVIQAVGALSKRDRLPYTPAFDAIVERFNALAGKSLEAHDVWRLIARLAK